MRSTSREAWGPGPARPQLSGGTLHVWYADLACIPAELLRVLSEPERRRARLIVDVRRRESWMRARAVTRELLARYAQPDAGSLRFRSAPAGKPVLIDGGSATGGRALRFSVSHCGGHALLAVGLAVAVGVDVEDGARTRDYRRVAQRARAQGVLSGDRLDQPPPGGGERFLREWVRAEAELKCLGRGLNGARGAARERQPLWCASLAELPGVPRAAAAVAARRPPRELRCWVRAPRAC